MVARKERQYYSACSTPPPQARWNIERFFKRGRSFERMDVSRTNAVPIIRNLFARIGSHRDETDTHLCIREP